MKKSIFFKAALLIIPVALLLDGLILAYLYRMTYQANLDACYDNITRAATVAASYFEYYDPYDINDTKQCDVIFEELCDVFNLVYVYAIKPDLEKNTEQYLSIGFGEDAKENAREERYSGLTINRKLKQPQLEAFNGNTEGTYYRESNEYGDSIICYMPVTRHYDMKTHDYVENDTVSFVGVEMSAEDVVNRFASRFKTTALFVVITTLLLVLSIISLLYVKVSKPIQKVSKRMSSFVSDRGKAFEEIEVKGNDEISEMANSFNTMAKEIDQYIEEINEFNIQKSQSDAELKVANRIQMGLLKPDSYYNNDANIEAIIKPAKDVGGDFYEYSKIPDEKIFMAIADVSGKGISAALFMSRAITLLREYAGRRLSPAEILYKYNNRLTEYNEKGVFITTFIAIYDMINKTLIYSNGGHNIPYIVREGKAIMLDKAHSMAAGVFSNADYEDAIIELQDDDIIFMYTDGVNEAEDVDGNMFGVENLEKVLCENAGRAGITKRVFRAVESFAKDAVQSDDITMITLRVGERGYSRKINVESKISNLAMINDIIDEVPGVSDDKKVFINLVAEEIFVNICSYAYGDGIGDVEFELKKLDDVTMTFKDSGTQFDQTKDITNLDEYHKETRVGGLGRFIASNVADRFDYKYEDGKNILKVVIKLK